MKNLMKLLLATALLVSVFSCVKGGETPDCPNGKEQAQLYLRLQTPAGFTSPASRALTYEQENTIDNIYVLIFDVSNSLVAIKEGQNVTSTPGNTNPAYSGEGSFTVTLAASKTSTDTYNIVVLSNAEAILSTTIGLDETSAYIGQKYANVIAAIYSGISGKMYSAAGDNTIPMWGESGALVIEPGNTNKTLQLTRAIARIDVGVGSVTKNGTAWEWSGLNASSEPIPFELAHVYVMRPNNRYAVIPNPSAAAGAPTIPTGTTSFSAAVSETTFGYAATASVTGGFSSQDIYVPESDIRMGAGGTLGDINHVNRMAIVVGGYYDGSATETFYRLDFAVNKILINVLRNHLYQFNISGVSGPGFPDVQTAYESQSMNMSVDIYDWNATNMAELFLDGPSYIMLGRSTNVPNDNRMAVVFRDVNTSDRIEMRTNIALDRFALSLNNGGALLDESDPSVIANNRFKVELKIVNGATYFVFTALQAYDEAATDNPSILTVTTGRMTFTFTIKQINSTPEDWLDGGNINTDVE